MVAERRDFLHSAPQLSVEEEQKKLDELSGSLNESFAVLESQEKLDRLDLRVLERLEVRGKLVRQILDIMENNIDNFDEIVVLLDLPKNIDRGRIKPLKGEELYESIERLVDDIMLQDVGIALPDEIVELPKGQDIFPTDGEGTNPIDRGSGVGVELKKREPREKLMAELLAELGVSYRLVKAGVDEKKVRPRGYVMFVLDEIDRAVSVNNAHHETTYVCKLPPMTDLDSTGYVERWKMFSGKRKDELVEEYGDGVVVVPWEKEYDDHPKMWKSKVMDYLLAWPQHKHRVVRTRSDSDIYREVAEPGLASIHSIAKRLVDSGMNMDRTNASRWVGRILKRIKKTNKKDYDEGTVTDGGKVLVKGGSDLDSLIFREAKIDPNLKDYWGLKSPEEGELSKIDFAKELITLSGKPYHKTTVIRFIQNEIERLDNAEKDCFVVKRKEPKKGSAIFYIKKELRDKLKEMLLEKMRNGKPSKIGKEYVYQEIPDVFKRVSSKEKPPQDWYLSGDFAKVLVEDFLVKNEKLGWVKKSVQESIQKALDTDFDKYKYQCSFFRRALYIEPNSDLAEFVKDAISKQMVEYGEPSFMTMIDIQHIVEQDPRWIIHGLPDGKRLDWVLRAHFEKYKDKVVSKKNISGLLSNHVNYFLAHKIAKDVVTERLAESGGGYSADVVTAVLSNKTTTMDKSSVWKVAKKELQSLLGGDDKYKDDFLQTRRGVVVKYNSKLWSDLAAKLSMLIDQYESVPLESDGEKSFTDIADHFFTKFPGIRNKVSVRVVARSVSVILNGLIRNGEVEEGVKKLVRFKKSGIQGYVVSDVVAVERIKEILDPHYETLEKYESLPNSITQFSLVKKLSTETGLTADQCKVRLDKFLSTLSTDDKETYTRKAPTLINNHLEVSEDPKFMARLRAYVLDQSSQD